jgi:hypothetical protein
VFALAPYVYPPEQVARRLIFKPNIPNWVNFGGPWNGKYWYILCPFGIYYGHLEYFMAILVIKW